jgi:hypothetical protein
MRRRPKQIKVVCKWCHDKACCDFQCGLTFLDTAEMLEAMRPAMKAIIDACPIKIDFGKKPEFDKLRNRYADREK